MHFSTKNTLKNNHNHIFKEILMPLEEQGKEEKCCSVKEFLCFINLMFFSLNVFVN